MRCVARRSLSLLARRQRRLRAAQQAMPVLCEPTLLVEPTITWEKDATVFETIFALDLSTPIPRVGVTLEAITKPFSDDNDVELESELKLYWLESGQTGGWLSSHFDIVDKFSGAEADDRHARVHAQAELGARYCGRGVQPTAGQATGCATWRSKARSTTSRSGLPNDAGRWSFSLVFVFPIVKRPLDDLTLDVLRGAVQQARHGRRPGPACYGRATRTGGSDAQRTESGVGCRHARRPRISASREERRAAGAAASDAAEPVHRPQAHRQAVDHRAVRPRHEPDRRQHRRVHHRRGRAGRRRQLLHGRSATGRPSRWPRPSSPKSRR